MNVVLTNLNRDDNDSRILTIAVSFGNSTPIEYKASYDDSDPRARFCNVEHELFMELSNFAVQRFGDAMIYQMELMEIIGAFLSNEFDLKLPAQLGTTKYCLPKPTRLKILRNRLSNWVTITKWKLRIGGPKGFAENETAG